LIDLEISKRKKGKGGSPSLHSPGNCKPGDRMDQSGSVKRPFHTLNTDRNRESGKTDATAITDDHIDDFIRKVVRSHNVIVKALRLMEMKDVLHLLRTSDIVMFFRRRENRLRSLIRDLRVESPVMILASD